MRVCLHDPGDVKHRSAADVFCHDGTVPVRALEPAPPVSPLLSALSHYPYISVNVISFPRASKALKVHERAETEDRELIGGAAGCGLRSMCDNERERHRPS